MKPFKTLREILVHQKDKGSVEDTAECVSKIPCHNCDSVYIAKTGKSLGKRLEEHTGRKNTEIVCRKVHTRAERKASICEMNRSANMDHVARDNHVIDWTGAEIIDREGHCRTRQVKESI